MCAKRQQDRPGLPIDRIGLMGAVVEEAPLDDRHMLYERKEDGMRTKVAIYPGAGSGGVVLQSRDGNDKTAQFPEIVRALDRLRSSLAAAVLVDGEVVALREDGTPAGFEALQARLHLSRVGATDIARTPVALILFDILIDGDQDVRAEPLIARRRRLERIFKRHTSAVIRVSEPVAGDGRALYAKAIKEGWEGLIAKRADSPYRSGKDHHDWRK